MTHITLQKDTAGKGPGMTGQTGALARLEMGIVAVRACGRCGPRRGTSLAAFFCVCLIERPPPVRRPSVCPRRTTQSDA